jgi:hypothetical protein
MLGLFYPYGIVLQAIAILHFIRRRPDAYWLWIILLGGGLGSLVYIVVEVVPDARLLHGAYQVFPRRKRIKQLEAQVFDNPSVGNYEELGDLLLEDGKYARARECFDKVLERSDALDPLYRRALCALALDDYPAAAADLASVTARDPKYDYHRAAGLYAHTLGRLGRVDEADALFAEVTRTSTLSETEYNYASFLAANGRPAEAREWVDRVLRKKASLPDYVRRRERPWFRRAAALAKKLPKQG